MICSSCSTSRNLRIFRSLKRVGGKWPHPYIAVDGDKFVCMDTFGDDNGCLVYSFGIANDWTFEDFIVQFGCSVFAFDPSVDYPLLQEQRTSWQKCQISKGSFQSRH